jgi:hypothetical protein
MADVVTRDPRARRSVPILPAPHQKLPIAREVWVAGFWPEVRVAALSRHPDFR